MTQAFLLLKSFLRDSEFGTTAMNLTSAMTKVILLTGATDGIGLETAKRLVALGHQVLLHGRSASKLKSLAKDLDNSNVETYRCDLSSLKDIPAFAEQIKGKHDKIDVIINNAGVFSTPNTRTDEGLDVRYAVNTLAPYLITKQLSPLLDANSRVINVSSAAQAPVNLNSLKGDLPLDDHAAYAQSKLAITMWSCQMAQNTNGPTVVSINPASLLGSKMVQEAFGIPGRDLGIGADILVRAALSAEFEKGNANGKYYDNDNARFANPHHDAMDMKKRQAVVTAMEDVLEKLGLLS
jgi:NAD(P)-dependent dehydrogenase (short-subunit alcohol dehydrogenase family)